MNYHIYFPHLKKIYTRYIAESSKQMTFLIYDQYVSH